MRRRWIIAITSVATLGFALAAALLGATATGANGRSFLVDFINRSASSPEMKVEIGALEAPLSAHPVASGIILSDHDGAFLKIDRIHLDWSRLALLALRLDIDRLSLGKVDLMRLPAPAPGKSPRGGASTAGGAPDLPIRIRLGAFELKALALGAPVLGAAAELALTGAAALGPIKDGAQATLHIRRLDAPGDISLDARASADGKFAVALAATEPQGGLIARLAKLPGLPAVDAHIDGEGPLDDFNAKIQASAGDELAAAGDAHIKRQGAARRIDFALKGKFAAALPKALAPYFDGETRLTGAAALADDGGAKIDDATLVASAFKLEATGAIDAARNINGTARLSGGANDGAGFHARVIDGDAHVTGSLDKPDARAHLLVEDAHSPAGRFGRFALDAKLVADAPLTDPAAHIDIDAKASGSDLGFFDLGLAEALGPQPSFALIARASAAGDADVSLAKIETRAAEINYSGRAGPSLLDGRLVVAAPDLSLLSALAGKPLRGALNFSAQLSGSPREETISAALNGAVASPGVDMAALDGLLGRKVTLAGKIDTLPGGGLRFESVALRADHMQVNVTGAAAHDASDVVARIDIPDIKHADARLAGRAALSATLGGGLDAPTLDAQASLDDVRAAGRALQKLGLRANARDLRTAPRIDAELTGTVEGKATTGALKAARAGAGWSIDALQFHLGRVALDGAATLGAGNLATGRVTLRAPDLDELSVFAMQKLAGAVSADIALDAKDGAQNMSINASATGLRAQEIALDRLSANLKGRDLYRRPALDGDAALDTLRFGKETITKARILAKPAGEATALEITADARGFNVAGKADLVPGARTRVDLSALGVTRAGKRVALASPATITLGGGSVDIKNLALAIGGGRLDLDGSIGDRLDLTAKAKGLPLAMAAMADPSLAFDGTLDADARITGSKSAPAGEWSLHGAKLSAPQMRSNGLPAAELNAKGRLSGGRSTLDAEIALGATSRVKITGAAPLGAEGALDLVVTGGLDAALANTALAAGGQTLRGKADIDLRLAGRATAPTVGGSVTLRDGAFADPLNGVYLDKMAARLDGKGQELTISSFTATTKNGGQIGVTGQISVASEAGFPGTLRIVARNAQLASTDIVTSAADLDLAISGPLARAPKVGGRVTLTTMEVTLPDRIPGGLKPLPDAAHIDAKGFAKEMLALERKQKEKAARKSNFDAAVDLSISAPNRIFVRGHGVDAEFGGDLRLTGTLQKPTATGAFDLRRGKLSLLTQRIDMTRGKLTFAGGLTPELDFTAETQAADVTARISISGPATLPVFAFSSTPELPQDEVLSRLLFAKASGSLSPFQAVQLATALAQFSGAASGVDAFEKMRKALGVDSLDLDAGGKNGSGPTVGASRYLTDNISVGVRTGTKPEQSAVNVGIDVTKKLRVQGETSMDGKTSLGVGVEWEY